MEYSIGSQYGANVETNAGNVTEWVLPGGLASKFIVLTKAGGSERFTPLHEISSVPGKDVCAPPSAVTLSMNA
jgi:hypothetical protein